MSHTLWRTFCSISEKFLLSGVVKLDRCVMPSVLKLSEGSLSELVCSAVKALQEGSLVAVPTDTLYGLAALAQHSQAIEEIYRVKKRNPLKPLAVCVAHVSDIFKWAEVTVPEDLLWELLPGPVTLVFNRTPALNKSLNPDTSLIGIRIPDSEFIRAVTKACGAPLALTSANISNQRSPLAVEEFREIWDDVAHVFDGGVIGSQCGLTSDSKQGVLRVNEKNSSANLQENQKLSVINSVALSENSVREGSTVVNLSVKGYYSVLRDGIALDNTLDKLHRYFRASSTSIMKGNQVKNVERDEVVQYHILTHLKDVVQALLQPMGDTSKLYVRPPPSSDADPSRIPPQIFGTSDLTNNLCCSLEAVLIHGLKNSYSSRVSSFFGTARDRMPVPNFWPVAMSVCHKDDIKQVCGLSYITSDVGRGRAWLRLMLNGGQVSSYLDALTREHGVLRDYYHGGALLRREESCCQLLGTLQPLGTLQFQLATNASVLNSWTQTPLVLAGLWAPPSGHTVPGWSQPVELAAEVTPLESEEEAQRRRRERERAAVFIEETPLNDHLLHAILASTPTTSFIGLEKSIEQEADALPAPKPLVVRTLHPRSGVEVGDSIHETHGMSDQDDETAPELEEHAGVEDGNESLESSSLMNQSDDGSIVTSSSSLDFNTLLARRLDSVDYRYVNTEDVALLEETETPSTASPVEGGASSPVQAAGAAQGPASLVKSTADAESRRSALVSRLCPQIGLDEQNYQCQGCRVFIGLFYGQFRVCTMDGHSYCTECHSNSTAVVPARVLHNWDLQQYAVCDANRAWLLKCIDAPIIDVRAANPRLYEHVEELDRLKTLRTQLLYLRAYLFTCSAGGDAADALRRAFSAREHFYEHVHLYSVADLLLVSRGGLLCEVQEAVSCAQLHVRDCTRCCARGFLCEVCRADDVIFPFQLHVAQTCPDCCAVYHRSCAPRLTDCPRCVRRRKRLDLQHQQEDVGYEATTSVAQYEPVEGVSSDRRPMGDGQQINETDEQGASVPQKYERLDLAEDDLSQSLTKPIDVHCDSSVEGHR